MVRDAQLPVTRANGDRRAFLDAQHGAERLGAIALLAMLVRAIIPAGYMLAEADTGSGR
jgi:hypothetical protein